MSNPPLSPAGLRGAVDLSSLVAARNAGPRAGQGAASQRSAQSAVVTEANDSSAGQLLELSNSVPVVVEFYGQGVAPALEAIVESYGGEIALATVDVASSPQMVRAFQIDQVPMVVALIAGQPYPLFAGNYPEDQVRELFGKLLELAKQQSVTGRIPVDGSTEAAEEPLPPHHQEAYDAIAAGDYETAIAEYRSALAQNPRDSLATAGLAQVSLLHRLAGADAGAIRSAAASDPTNSDAQLAVADLDMAGGHVDDAFDRLLEVFPALDAAAKNNVRTRLLEYFEITGTDDPRVIAARKRLTMLLY